MTTINGLPASAGLGSGGQPAAASSAMGEGEFLTLLMTQLQHQDPTAPMEATQFLDQITAMNQVQQLMESKHLMSQMVLGITALNNESAVDLVGELVEVSGGGFHHEPHANEELNFELGADAVEGVVTIFGEDGEQIDTIELEELEAGEHTVTWTPPDGRSGDFHFEVVAQDAEGDDVAATTRVTGLVEELRFDRGLPVLLVNGQEITLDMILRVIAQSDETTDAPEQGQEDPTNKGMMPWIGART